MSDEMCKIEVKDTRVSMSETHQREITIVGKSLSECMEYYEKLAEGK
ncbi:hypothetical protein [Bacteroides sp.]|nr:hypothetical protein [Bacteroides sp.]MDD3040574.1 hypothetical protein [Bacteroides sp.]